MTARWRITTWVHKNYVLEIRDRPIRDKEFILVRNYLKTVGEFKELGFWGWRRWWWRWSNSGIQQRGGLPTRVGGIFFVGLIGMRRLIRRFRILFLYPFLPSSSPLCVSSSTNLSLRFVMFFSQAQQQLLLHGFFFFFFLAPNPPKCSGIGNPSSRPKNLFFFFFFISLVMIPLVLNPLISPNKEFERYIAKSTEVIVG